MSTKAIREVLETHTHLHPHSDMWAKALAEVEAIERAAKALTDDAKGVWPKNSAALNERDRAHRLMWVIDQQTKEP